MRKLFAFLMLAIFVSFSFEGFAQTGPWTWMHPTPQGNTLRYVKYWDANNWYAVGYVGTFMKTTNAGATWTWSHTGLGEFGTSGQKNWIYGAHFFNQNTGLILGQGNANGTNGIWRTTNGGQTWDTTNVVPFTTGTFYFASFVNSTLGYACGTGAPYVYRTTDGGLTWAGVTSPTTTAYDIYASDSLNVIISNASGNVRKSTDGGATWTTILTGASATLYKLTFVNANTGFTAGGTTAATMFRYTTNGGLNWTVPSNTGLPASTMYDIDAKTVAVSTNKLEEGFESTTFPPTGWSSVNVAGSVVWTRSTSLPHSGSASAYIQYQAATGGPDGNDWLISPKINGIAAGDSITFWWKNSFSSAYPPDSLFVRVSTTDTALASFTNYVVKLDGSTLPSTWTRYAYSLSAFAGQNIHIAFQHKDTDGNGGYLDDIAIGPQTPPTLSSNVYMTGNSFAIYKTTNMGTSWDTVGFLADVSLQPWTSTYYSTDMIPGSSTDDFLTVGSYGLINRRVGTANSVFTKLAKPGAHNDVWASNSTGTGVVIAVGAPSITGTVFDQIVRSTDGGTTWGVVPYSATSRTTFNCIQMIDNNTGYACGTLSALYRTTNGGVSFDSVAIDVLANGTHNFRKVDFINANTGWVFGTFISAQTDSATVYKTTNAGVNWTKQYVPQYSGSSSGLSRGVYGADMVDANTGFLVSYQPRPYRTTDGGTTWTIDSIPDGFGGFMYDIQMFSATSGYISGSSGRLYKLTTGNFWDTVSVPTRSYSFNGLAFASPSAGYLFGSSGVAFSTTNSGTTWTKGNTNGSTMNNGFLTSDFKAFAVGSSGYIFKNNNVLTGVAGNENSLLPTKYALEQNYPNPFNPTTTIKFSIPKAGIVTLKIYDVAGREVMRLLNNQSVSAGYQTQLFNGSMLSSGIYFYSLIVDNNLIATKKMVLVK